ncbi:MAG TPA: hypothetical protein VLF71_06050 [Candidatus Saccharimonadales bacterium]|nr:hypothetical protein [Candidatus Saccharimonadales bacterium]
MQRFTRILITAVIGTASLFAVAGGLAPAVASAAATDPFQDICAINGASGSSVCHANGQNNLSGPNGIIIKVANIFAFVTGVGAVFVILIGGFMYITANGDSGKANSARSAVLYASVGLVVVVIGRAIIGFVITKFR